VLRPDNAGSAKEKTAVVGITSMAPPRGGLKGSYRQRKKAMAPAPARKKPKNAQPPQQGGDVGR